MEREIITRKEAKALGLKRYYTGEKCAYDHIDERYINTGVCIQCSRDNTKRYRQQNIKSISEYQRKRREEIKAGTFVGRKTKSTPKVDKWENHKSLSHLNIKVVRALRIIPDDNTTDVNGAYDFGR